MRVFGLWYGGNGYSHGEMPLDGESWPTLADAKADLIDRYHSGYWDSSSRGQVIDVDEDGVTRLGESSGSLRPCVDTETSIDLYPSRRIGRKKWTVGDEPYARLVLGPRGGVRVESY
ncbi:hypothetical protein O7614_26775 [Micromonospora sp. WMMD961]|uniref:hypothetical protein n=1 Tax=Micromonospora sp. WMMD961 TaxID=3016100 RepID=UPI002417EC2E|nr:hypothetical protein [Micromonospora sp. WMMD961]MDG4783269.1 hypothetical protein [Micromonospora sp. WMMD961]